MSYVIWHDDGYLESFNNCTIWLTPDAGQALTFARLEEAELVVRCLSWLASSELRVRRFAEGS